MNKLITCFIVMMSFSMISCEVEDSSCSDAEYSTIYDSRDGFASEFADNQSYNVDSVISLAEAKSKLYDLLKGLTYSQVSADNHLIRYAVIDNAEQYAPFQQFNTVEPEFSDVDFLKEIVIVFDGGILSSAGDYIRIDQVCGKDLVLSYVSVEEHTLSEFQLYKMIKINRNNYSIVLKESMND